MELQLQEKNAQTLINTWRNNPVAYFKDALGIENMWSGELAILEMVPIAIREKRNIIVPSGHSLGKDFVCGGLVPYFLQAWGPCVVITTAPTERQVHSVMWGEIENHYIKAKIPLPGRLLSCRIDVKPNWYALGFTTKETGSMVGKFQGFHANRVFVVASEAQAIADNVFEQIDAILTGEIGLMIEIGNPLRSSGHFAQEIKARSKNIVLELSCLDNPNYLERKTVIPGLCSYDWVEDKRDKWGEQDPRWHARVLGKIPTSSIDTVFSSDLIDKMLRIEIRDARIHRGIAVDVARFGDDETVIYGGTNGKVEYSDIYTGVQTDVTATRAVVMNNKVNGNFIAVDTDGLGSGTTDTLRSMRLRNVNIIEIHSAAKEYVDPQYENLRAHMWFIAKDRAENGKAAIPDDQMLKEELQEVRYFINKRGKIQIEEKSDIKERLGRSTNRADAWIYFQYAMSQARPVSGAEYSTHSGRDSGITCPNRGGGFMAA